MTKPDTTRWAVFGTGAIAARFADDMRHSKRGRVVAVGSRRPERAASFAAAIGPEIVSGTFDRLLARGDIDAVYLATPNDLHREHALAVIAAGKSVLVEKPFALSAAEAREIADAGRTAGILVMEAMWMRFTPGIRRLKRIVDEGRIGDIRRIDVSVSFRNAYSASSPLHDLSCGGALLDLGVYPISLAVHLAGPPETVRATTIAAPNGAIFAATLLLGYDKALATLACGFDAEGANEAVIVGTQGIATAHRSVLCPPMISVRRTGADAGASAPSPAAPSGRKPRVAALASLRTLGSGLKVRRIPTLYEGSGLQYQADHFSKCLAKGLTESPVMPLGESIEVLDIVERAKA